MRRFVDPARRAAVSDAAAAAGVPFLGVWLDAPLAVLEARIAGRRGDASDATVAVLHEAARELAAAWRLALRWTRPRPTSKK